MLVLFNHIFSFSASLSDIIGMITSILEAVSFIFVFNRLDDSENNSASGGQIQLQIKAYEEHVNAILVYFETPIRENDLVNQNIDTLYDKVI